MSTWERDQPFKGTNLERLFPDWSKAESTLGGTAVLPPIAGTRCPAVFAKAAPQTPFHYIATEMVAGGAPLSETLSLRKAKGEFNIFDRSSYQTGIFKDGGACGKEIYTLG